MMNTEINIKESKLENMKCRIIELEKENLKTKEKSEAVMVDEIKSIIIEEFLKNY